MRWWKSLSIKVKFLFGIGCVLLLTIINAVLSVYALHTIRARAQCSRVSFRYPAERSAPLEKRLAPGQTEKNQRFSGVAGIFFKRGEAGRPAAGVDPSYPRANQF